MPFEGLTTHIKKILIDLPDTPGVYYFYNSKGALIYVGKATSLHSRVRSYFSGRKTPRPIEEMIHEVVDIKVTQTDSVLEAIILEGAEIKLHQPVYNVLGKDDKSWNYLVITKEAYPHLQSLRQHELNQLSVVERKKRFLHIFGPYPGLSTKVAVRMLRRLFHMCTCKVGDSSCLYEQMGYCHGVYRKAITETWYKKYVVDQLVLFLQGKKKRVLANLEKQMQESAKKEEFEEASTYKYRIESLQRIQDVALINRQFYQDFSSSDASIRIEGYDISNLGSTGMVGSMVVSIGGVITPNQYRKFTIKHVSGQSDVACLQEVLERRFKHPEWKFPTVVMVDGGKPQVSVAKRVLRSYGLQIPVVGIAKGAKRKRNDFILGNRTKKLEDFVLEHKEILIALRDEAHRFAITFQRQKRKIVRKKESLPPSG